MLPALLATSPPRVSSQPNMDAAIALPSVRVKLGHSDGLNDVASVVTVRIVPNFPYGPEPLPLRPPPNPSPKLSSRLEYVVVSVMLLDAMDCPVVESAIDMRADSFKDGARSESPPMSERSDGRERTGERGGRIGGTSSRSLAVPVGVRRPSVSVPSAVPASLDDAVSSGL